MTQRTYFKLPINVDEGFPQAFQMGFNGQLYAFRLYVNILATEANSAEDHIFDLPENGAFLVLQIARQTAAGGQVIFQRKLVKNLETPAEELMILFKEMRVAKPNLNGAGAFGSVITGGVAARWAA